MSIRKAFGMMLGGCLAVIVAALPVAAPADARVLLPGEGRFVQQESADPRTYTDELLGLTVSLPEGWQAVTGGNDYDVALVSPEAQDGGVGAFVTLLNLPGLGPDATLESALESVASQVEGTVEPFTAGASGGFQVVFTDDAESGVQHLVLLPYGDQGEALYIQTFAPTDQDATVLSILDSLELDPPRPDMDAANAAWQASLAEDGRLVYGDPDAPIKMVEFYSFTCPHCVNYAFPISRLIALDVEAGRVQIELVPIVSDPYAELATKAVYCAAEQGAGYSANEALFAGYLNSGYQYAYSEEGIAEILGGLDAGLDMAALDTCIAADSFADVIDEGRARFTDYGLTGTPTVLLGTADAEIQPLQLPDGRVWSGAIPVEALRTIFDRLEAGTPLADVVSRLMEAPN